MFNRSNRVDEFIEIYNTHHLTQDLSGFRIASNVSYTFPSNTLIAPNAYLVVVSTAGQYTNVANTGPYLGSLLHNPAPGEVVLVNRSGAILLDAAYDCDAPWPASADGGGHSLVLARPSYGEGDARAWAASARIGGSPGFGEK